MGRVEEGESSGVRWAGAGIHTRGLASLPDLDPGLLSLSFIICQMGLLAIPTWQGLGETERGSTPEVRGPGTYWL